MSHFVTVWVITKQLKASAWYSLFCIKVMQYVHVPLCQTYHRMKTIVQRESFVSGNFLELLKIKFSQLKLLRIVGNDSLWMWQVTTPTIMHRQETMKDIELVQTRYEVATVNWSHHVYVAAWEAAVGQILHYEEKRSNIHNPYAVVVVENNDTPIDNDALVPYQNFHGLKFHKLFQNRKFAKVFTCERFPLYGICQQGHRFLIYWSFLNNNNPNCSISAPFPIKIWDLRRI